MVEPGTNCGVTCADKGSLCDGEALQDASSATEKCQAVCNTFEGPGAEGSGCICRPGQAPPFRRDGFPKCSDPMQADEGEQNVCSCGGRLLLGQMGRRKGKRTIPGRGKKDAKRKKKKRKDRDQGGAFGGYFHVEPGTTCETVCADKGSKCDEEALNWAASDDPKCEDVCNTLKPGTTPPSPGPAGPGCLCDSTTPSFSKIDGQQMCDEPSDPPDGFKNLCSCWGGKTLLQTASNLSVPSFLQMGAKPSTGKGHPKKDKRRKGALGDRRKIKRKQDRDQGGAFGGYFFMEPGQVCSDICAEHGTQCDQEALTDASSAEPKCNAVVERLGGCSGLELPPPEPPQKHCPTPDGVFRSCIIWGDPHFSQTFQTSGDLTAENHGDQRLGQRGGGNANHYDVGLFWLFRSKTGLYQAQAFMCDVAEQVTTLGGLAIKVGLDTFVLARGPKTGPPSDGPHINWQGDAKDWAFQIYIDGDLIDYTELGDEAVDSDHIQAVGGGLSRGQFWAQQMSVAQDKHKSFGPVCFGDAGKKFSAQATTFEAKLFEPTVLLELALDEIDLTDANQLCNLQKGFDSRVPGTTVAPVDSMGESIFPVRVLKQLCHVCGMHEGGSDAARAAKTGYSGCNPASRRKPQSSEEYCSALGDDIFAAAKTNCAAFEGDGDWYEACLIEACEMKGDVADLIDANEHIANDNEE